jgi:hypothetical protein
LIAAFILFEKIAIVLLIAGRNENQLVTSTESALK